MPARQRRRWWATGRRRRRRRAAMPASARAAALQASGASRPRRTHSWAATQCDGTLARGSSLGRGKRGAERCRERLGTGSRGTHLPSCALPSRSAVATPLRLRSPVYSVYSLKSRAASLLCVLFFSLLAPLPTRSATFSAYVAASPAVVASYTKPNAPRPIGGPSTHVLSRVPTGSSIADARRDLHYIRPRRAAPHRRVRTRRLVLARALA